MLQRSWDAPYPDCKHPRKSRCDFPLRSVRELFLDCGVFEGTCERDDRFAGWGLYDSCLNLRFKRLERDRGGQRLSLSWRSSLQAVS
jgi:hypothetical protein